MKSKLQLTLLIGSLEEKVSSIEQMSEKEVSDEVSTILSKTYGFARKEGKVSGYDFLNKAVFYKKIKDKKILELFLLIMERSEERELMFANMKNKKDIESFSLKSEDFFFDKKLVAFFKKNKNEYPLCLSFMKNLVLDYKKYPAFLHYSPWLMNFLEKQDLKNEDEKIIKENINKLHVSELASYVDNILLRTELDFSKDLALKMQTYLEGALEKVKTTQLLATYKDLRPFNNVIDEGMETVSKAIKTILDRREHVPNGPQKKLIRKMSAYSGKKLTLKEAQAIDNKLKKESHLNSKGKK